MISRGAGTMLLTLLWSSTWLLSSVAAEPQEGQLALRGRGLASSPSPPAEAEECDSACQMTIGAIHAVEDQVVRTYAMTLEFLLIAVGGDRVKHSEKLDGYISDYETYEYKIKNGHDCSSERRRRTGRRLAGASDVCHDIKPIPSSMAADVDALESKFDDLKYYLLKYAPEVNNSFYYQEALLKIKKNSNYVLEALDGIIAKYYGYAEFNDYAMPPQSEMFARRQLTYIEQMMKESLYIGLNFRQQFYLEELLVTERLFQESHESLVYGNAVAGVPELRNMCTLHDMLKVETAWTSFQSELKRIKDNQVFATLALEEQKGYVAENAADPELVTAIKGFTAGWNQYAGTDLERSAQLISAYIETAQKPYIDTDRAVGEQSYHNTHAKYHPKYRDILYARNYYDIFFLDMQGNCIYSVYKEPDFATSFHPDAAAALGPYKDSGLGEAYEASLADMDSVHVIDWKPYGPSGGALASFLSKGIKDSDGNKIGVFVTQMHPDAEPAKAKPELMEEVEAKRKDLEYKQVDALSQFVSQDDSCNPAPDITETEWNNLLAETAKQRSLTQKVVRKYFQFIQYSRMGKTDKASSTKADIRALLLQGTSSVRTCVTGDSAFGIPAPPSQHIVDELLDLWHDWQLLEETISMSYESGDAGSTALTTLSQIESLGQKCLAIMAKTSEALVYESKHEKPAIKSAVIELAERQLILIEKMSKEALLVTIDKEFEDNAISFHESVNAFLVTHEDLLRGRHHAHDGDSHDGGHRRLAGTSAAWSLHAQIFTDMDIDPTHDACTLNKMVEVKTSFDELNALLQQIVGNGTEAADVLLEQVGYLSTKAYDHMYDAVYMYIKGYGYCHDSNSQKDWEAILQESAKLPYLFQKAQTEFGLIAGGISAQWATNAEVALADNERKIIEDARDPVLAEATERFKQGWRRFRDGDEAKTRMGLQVSYITLNPAPAGQKDEMDFAEGPEEYHATHKKYHPDYRAKLYENNYYDIFILDLEGNCIYSVYKELDFATNFDPNKDGEWKDSGLGEAWVAVMDAPQADKDKIHVIDWKPYGPSAGALASFLATGIRSAEGAFIGVYVTQMHPDSKPIDSPGMLSDALHSMDEVFDNLKFGNLGHGINPPPTQEVADALFHMDHQWSDVRTLLHAHHKDNEVAEQISLQDATLSHKMDELIQTIVDGAWHAHPGLQGTRVQVAAQQLALIQAMCRDVILIGQGVGGATRSGLSAKITKFNRNQNLLNNGGSLEDRRLQTQHKSDVAASTDVAVLEELAAVSALWDGETGLGMRFTNIAGGTIPTDAELKRTVEDTDSAADTIELSFETYAESTRTTTMMTLEILAPIPLTGDWAAGRTMQVAALLAANLINSDQIILPGYRIETVFFDDKCDATTSSQVVLRETSAKATYIALGGAGCSQVCADTSFVAETIGLPFVSYECPAEALSNTVDYSSLVRFGTVTTNSVEKGQTPATRALSKVAEMFQWDQVYVVTGDQSKYKPDADAAMAALEADGITSVYENAIETYFDQIVDMMGVIREGTKGKNRVIYVIGTESYFRKVICASIVAGMRTGITWFSVGTWRKEWWKKTDATTQFQETWMREAVAGSDLRNALAALSPAFNVFGQADTPDITADDRRKLFQDAYDTKEVDKVFEDSTEQYHEVHKEWHPIFRSLVFQREYQDLYIFDMDGNLVYSVYKESDFATNFRSTGTGRWKNTGLGEAFETARADPFNVTYIDFAEYGPGGSGLSAFLAMGITNEAGDVVGVYAVQMPASYERSIEELQPECTLETITASYEGALNVAGYGRPLLMDMEKPLTCFKGHSASSFLSLLDEHLAEGFPRGDIYTQVPDPYMDVRSHAADATCAIAMVVQALLTSGRGNTIEDIQKPDQKPGLYAEYIAALKNLDFDGASGRVRFEEYDPQRQDWVKGGNEKRNNLVVQQVQEGAIKEIGVIKYQSDQANQPEWMHIPTNSSWTAEFVDPPVPEEYFPWFIFQIIAPISIICIPITLGAIRYSRF